MNGRKNLGFYSLRHRFLTIAEETRDFPAVQLIMGHSDNSMASHYRERISDDRLEAVANHVRKWLFGLENTKSKGPERVSVGAGAADRADSCTASAALTIATLIPAPITAPFAVSEKTRPHT